jgi:hypothetical protein
LPRLAHVAGVHFEVGCVIVDKPVVLTLMFVPAFCRPLVVSEYVTQYGSQGLLEQALAAPRL